MKLAVDERQVERIGITQERSFAIKATGKAFKVLSSSLYRDKIRAIIRELSANARDSHVAAGRADLPFRVGLPNYLTPHLSIRDYGTGLSHDDVMTIYTTYFESTKTGSNDFIGALGLGSKSPFSYVDSFTVISFHDGQKRSYAAFIAEDGTPAISLTAEEPSTEPNGLEVSIPVARSVDFSQFSDRAAEVLAYFDPLPVIEGAPHFKFASREVLVSGSGWRVLRNTEGRSSRAVMGSVAYPIDTYAIPVAIPDALRPILKSGVEMDFDIGALDVTAGREDLSYDKSTVAALLTKAQEVASGVADEVQRRIDDCTTEYEARALFGTMFGHGGLGHLAGKRDFTFRGGRLSSDTFMLDFKEFEGLRVLAWTDASKKNRVRTFSALDDSVFIKASEDSKVIFDDLPRGTTGRMREYRKTAKKNAVYLIRTTDEAQRAAVLAALDGMPIINASTLPKPYYTRAARSAALVGCVVMRHANASDCFWTEATAFPSEGLYVAMRRGKPQRGEERDTIFGTLVGKAQALELLTADEKVYGIPAAMVKKLGSGWRNVREVLSERVSKALNEPDMLARRRAAALRGLVNGRFHLVDDRRAYLRRAANMLPSDHAFARMAKTLDTALTSRTDEHLDRLRDLAINLGVYAPISDAQAESEMNEIARVFAQYPLVWPVIDNWRGETPLATVLADYVLMCDAHAATRAASPVALAA